MDADDSPDTLSTAVVEAVAAKEGIDSTDVDQPLGEVVDSDALDSLFEPPGIAGSRTRGTVTFSFGGYDVLVYSDGRVELADRPNHAPSESVVSGSVASESVD